MGRNGPPGNLLPYIDHLPRYAGRDAYRWRDGVRWRSRTYATLHARTLAAASLLARSGLKPGGTVLIQGPDHPDWVEALLGTLRAGGVAVPLEAATPAELRNKVARLSEARLLVAPPDLEPPAGCRRIEFGTWGETGAGPPRAEIEANPGDRAEVVFTSGTTGEPKGVVLTHDNLASDFAPIQRAFDRREAFIRPIGSLPMISTLPLSHMFGQALNIFLGLHMGVTIVLVPPRPREILQAARRQKAWGLFTVPRVLDLLAAEVRRLLREQGALESLENRQPRFERWPFPLQALLFWRVQRLFGWRFRFIVSGGAALPEEVQRFWQRSGYLVAQGYGLTETAPIVTLANPFERRTGIVGRPLGGQEIKLGPDGEVLVRGRNVTSGYLGAAPQSGEWLHTGDVGELDAEGRLRIRGRLKDVIVTPEGENVHPPDVEAAFQGIAGVREAAVLGLPSGSGERVHAVLLLEGGATAGEVVRRANEKLLPRQRVRDFTIWPGQDLPRTPTGKVRKGVVRDRILALQQEAGAEAPAGAAEPGSLRRLLARVARVRPERLEETTLLVEGLGMASLDLVELTVAVEEEFGVSLPEDRLADATVGDLERLVRDLSSSPAAPEERTAPSPAPPATAPVSAATGPLPAATRMIAGNEPGAVRRAGRGSLRMPRWAQRAPVRLLRRCLEEILYRPVVFFYGRPEIVGLEHLRTMRPPFLFVANHRGYFDTGLFKALLPLPLRGRIAPGMTTRYHRLFFGQAAGSLARYGKEWFQVRLVEFLFGAWPLPETAGFRDSLSYAGELADAGNSILIFPEGRHVPEGTVQPFRQGIGIFARDLRAPVIPSYVEGTAEVFPDDAWWARFGRTRLTLGAPLLIEPGADPAVATRLIEAAVRALEAGFRPPDGRGALQGRDAPPGRGAGHGRS